MSGNKIITIDEKVICQWTDESVENLAVSFNPEYLAYAIDFVGNNAKFRFKGNDLDPVAFLSSDAVRSGLIMPIQSTTHS